MEKTDLPYTPPKGKTDKLQTNINKINGIYFIPHSLLYYTPICIIPYSDFYVKLKDE